MGKDEPEVTAEMKLETAEEQLRSVNRFLDAIVENIPDMIFVKDAKTLLFERFNRAGEELLGWTRAELIGKTDHDFYPKEQADFFHEKDRETLGNKVLVDIPEEPIETKAKGLRWLHTKKVPVLDENGTPRWLLGISEDITARKAAEERARSLEEILGAVASPEEEEAHEHASAAMREALDAADSAASDAKATVLLLGETGVGKGWMARRIHAKSPRAAKPFFEVNCASLSPQLVESELFGHERGAFTGATTQKRGLAEVAEGGTLFLDEIGELPHVVQAQILTFLDSRTFRRVGGTRNLNADVRLLAATNVDLKSAGDKGAFRKDLYYRLSVFPVTIPPLRERREEIPVLARSILASLKNSTKRRIGLDRMVVAALARYDWPGNVRELRNALERALILARGAPIDVAHLPAELRGKGKARGAVSADLTLEEVERQHIDRVLEAVAGNRTHAAEKLGISRSTLKRKLAEMGKPDEDDAG